MTILFVLAVLSSGRCCDSHGVPRSTIAAREDMAPKAVFGKRRHDVGPEAYYALAEHPEFHRVVALENPRQTVGSATLIDATHALTAAHLVEDSALAYWIRTPDGQRVRALRVVIHPEFDRARDTVSSVDLALLELERPISGIGVAVLYTGDAEVGHRGVVVGMGPVRPANQAHAADTIWRRNAFENMIDATQGPRGRGDPTLYLAADFDSPTDSTVSSLGDAVPLPLEGDAEGGDSGGALFFEREGNWVLAGITAQTAYSLERLREFERYGFYGSVTRWTRISRQHTWIRSLVAGGTGTPGNLKE